MGTVAIHAPKSPVTKGSQSMATATLPNICKMPPPPPPFAPTPLPNIGQSGKQPKGYTTTVKFDGQPVAIRGASFGSSGDIASKGTGGGIVSSNAEGPTTFIAPGAIDVTCEGKNVQLLGDQMLNNCGPAGTPANSATMAGVLHGPQINAQVDELGVRKEAEAICTARCECKAERAVRIQHCIHKKLKARQAQTPRLKTEVVFRMKGKGGGPEPVMSRKQPWRQSRNWRIKGSRRPDAIVVAEGAKPWVGDNIVALIECKWVSLAGKQDVPNPGQMSDYLEIAGRDKKKVVEMNDDNCKCSDDDEKKKVPVPVPSRVRSEQREEEPMLSPAVTKPVAAAVAAACAIGIAVLLAPEIAVVAAAAGVLGLLAGGSSSGSGGGYDGV